MPSSDPMTISLTPELKRFINAHVETGRYQTASEVVRAGLRLLARTDPPSMIDPVRKPLHARPADRSDAR